MRGPQPGPAPASAEGGGRARQCRQCLGTQGSCRRHRALLTQPPSSRQSHPARAGLRTHVLPVTSAGKAPLMPSQPPRPLRPNHHQQPHPLPACPALLFFCTYHHLPHGVCLFTVWSPTPPTALKCHLRDSRDAAPFDHRCVPSAQRRPWDAVSTREVFAERGTKHPAPIAQARAPWPGPLQPPPAPPRGQLLCGTHSARPGVPAGAESPPEPTEETPLPPQPRERAESP